MDTFAAATAIVTGLLMLAAVVYNKWFGQLDEDRDGERLGGGLVLLTVIGCVAVILAERFGPHVS